MPPPTRRTRREGYKPTMPTTRKSRLADACSAPAPKSRKPRPLSPQQSRFVAEYVQDWNASKAAVRAGYSVGRATALLKHPEVAAYIKKCRDTIAEQVQERVTLASERTLKEMAAVAYFNVRDYVRPDGTWKNITELTPEQAIALAGAEITETWVGKGAARKRTVSTNPRFISKLSALDMAAKVMGDYKRDNEQRRSARDMTDDDIRLRILELMGQAKPAAETLQ